jgi:predicted nucleic acid-binding protein
VRFIDTNVVIRVLTGDDTAKAEAAQQLLERLEDGTEEAFTSEAVVAEIFFVLTSPRQYGMGRADAAARVRPILAARGLYLDAKLVVQRAVAVYEAHSQLDFEDALSVAHMESRGIDQIVSYDRGFDSVEGVARIEP